MLFALPKKFVSLVFTWLAFFFFFPPVFGSGFKYYFLGMTFSDTLFKFHLWWSLLFAYLNIYIPFFPPLK